ncbi:hypothetical protein CAEBREN_14923 [Caenorhabditis brenneri]|uniref:Uncharacterized protein n=1 Tax=Caenorhabditis brenneri TaxID=135651 RepID=G0M8U0_CAEBE|nr:hypothetical protein CAEBREN_14923 [Caenorhabditis brenneri]
MADKNATLFYEQNVKNNIMSSNMFRFLHFSFYLPSYQKMFLSYLHTPEFLSTSLWIIFILELPLHIFGAYCILIKTPKLMKSVKWIMLNLHFWSVALDWGITFLTKPFVLFPAMAGIPLGVLSSLGVPTGIQIYLIVTLFCGESYSEKKIFRVEFPVECAAIVSIFENRYYLTFGKNTLWRHVRNPFMIFNYFLASSIFLPAYLNAPDQASGLQKLYEHLPELPDYIHNLNLYVIATEYSMVIGPVVFMGALLLSEALAFMVLMYLGTQKALKLMTMSENTVYMHRRFLRALYIQTCVIILNMGVPLFYLGLAVPLNYYNQAANNICFIVYALHGLSSTIVMIWIHKPYRTTFLKIFCCRKSKPVAEERRKSGTDGITKSTFNITICNVNIVLNANAT